MTLYETNSTNPRHLGYVGSLRNSGDEAGDAWNTPDEILEMARFVLNGIDLDPFSSTEANERVRARRFFSLEYSAFDQERWKARSVFMNPPYSRGRCKMAIGRLIEEFEAKSFLSAFVLVNNMTDTVWFDAIRRIATRRCDLRGRLSFVTNDNKTISGNTRGQVIFLLEHRQSTTVSRFDARMGNIGCVYGKPIA